MVFFALKPTYWMGSSRKDMKAMPEEVQDTFGYALFQAQVGERSPKAKALKGFGGGSVVEIVEDMQGSTYRAVYTVRFEKAVCVLHVFQKKSRAGIRTPRADVELIRKRLKEAEQHHKEMRQ